ncbi:hypothetical protein OPT61_g10745 [Boeremia exigua]|uniref:Uncharacterized protein n=1 Tax=Boeremia exigua TaxID=749465 RepID=A0ACC2HPK4_9PLEO|nr:hypothetical protein OPT61_g10745 [Boeremia exigua]
MVDRQIRCWDSVRLHVNNVVVSHKQGPEATVVEIVSRKSLKERKVSKAFNARVVAVLYAQRRSTPGGTVVSVAVACVSQPNSGATRLAHLTYTAPQPRRGFKRRQPGSRRRRDTTETLAIMRSHRRGDRETSTLTSWQRRAGIRKVGLWIRRGWSDE